MASPVSFHQLHMRALVLPALPASLQPSDCIARARLAEIRVVPRSATCCPQPPSSRCCWLLARSHCMASHHPLLLFAAAVALLLVCADRQAPAASSSPAEPKLQIEQDKKRLYIKWSERETNKWMEWQMRGCSVVAQ